jgi:hypothetical protein
MSLVTLYQCKDCKTVIAFKFGADFEKDGWCWNCHSTNFDIIVESVMLNSEAIEKNHSGQG